MKKVLRREKILYSSQNLLFEWLPYEEGIKTKAFTMLGISIVV